MLHQLEIIWILFIQSMTAWLVVPMRVVSMLGQEEFFMLVMPALYWCLDGWLGLRVGLMLLLSNEINCIAKLAFFSPRPYWFDTRVKGLASEASFGLPSGHAQNAAGIWGLLAASVRETSVKVVLVVLIFLIGLSRIILGVHFISDVLAGWLIGGLLVWIFTRVERPLARWLRRRSLPEMLAMALGSAVLMIALVLLTYAVVGSGQIPSTWGQNALAAQPDAGPINPLDISGAFTIAGTWFGFLAGFAWLYHRQGGFDASGMPGQRLLRYLIGATGVFVFYFVLGKIFPRSADAISYSLRFVRYTLVGLWISALAPLVFERLGLSKVQVKEVPPLSVP